MTSTILSDLIQKRFGAPLSPTGDVDAPPALAQMLGRGSCRSFRDTPVPVALQDLLCAAAMSAPTKSDLQQRDIILLRAPEQRAELARLVGGQAWVAGAPMLAVFCGNNLRQRQVHDWHGIPFANDHLDAFFNAAGDAAIALGAFVTAAEMMGLGCCPISAVRNEARAVSSLLGLPEYVFPFAGLAFGYPASPLPDVSMRLPLQVTCHVDRFGAQGTRDAIAAYNTRRAAAHPYSEQRLEQAFGTSQTYGWSEDKARQYSQPERADFGAYVQAQGFKLT